MDVCVGGLVVWLGSSRVVPRGCVVWRVSVLVVVRWIRSIRSIACVRNSRREGVPTSRQHKERRGLCSYCSVQHNQPVSSDKQLAASQPAREEERKKFGATQQGAMQIPATNEEERQSTNDKNNVKRRRGSLVGSSWSGKQGRTRPDRTGPDRSK